MERAWWSARAAAGLPVMPIHSAISSRFPLLEGVPSIQALMEDPQYAQVRAEFESYPDHQAPDVSARPDAAPGPHGPVPVRVYNDGAGGGPVRSTGRDAGESGPDLGVDLAFDDRGRRRYLVSTANPIHAVPRIVGRQLGLIPGV
jgi:hypothetical protein